MNRARRAALTGAVAAALLVAVPAAARAAPPNDVTSTEMRSLAERAAQDPTALARLRRVERVDGTPVDMQTVLGQAGDPALRGRLRVLAAPSTDGAGPATTPPAVDARRDASRILDEARFKPPAEPRPLRGFFRWLGARLEPVVRFLRPVGRPFAFVWRAITTNWKWGLLAGGAIALLALIASVRLIRRRGRGLAVAGGRRRDRTRGLDPDDLDRQADVAEAAGRFDEAFRLRFLAGLVRLDRAGVVELRPSLTSGALRRQVPSSSLRGLTVRFDEIVFGGRPAGPEDMEQARSEWPRTMEEVSR